MNDTGALTRTVIRERAARWWHPLWRQISLTWSVLLGLLSTSVAATVSTRVAPVPIRPPYRVLQLAYDSNQVLRLAPADDPSRLTRLFYGEPITNTQFVADLPDRDEGGSGLQNRGGVNRSPRQARPQYKLDQWGTEHGLPARKVRAIHRTRDGFLWIGTVGGLARFDGVQFTVFSETNCPEMQREGSIVRAFFQDPQGRLWMGTERGMLCRERNRFVPFPGQNALRGTVVNSLARREAGGFWIATGAGLSYWDGRRVLPWVSAESSQVGTSINVVREAAPNRLWLGSSLGIFEIDLATQLIHRSCVFTNRAYGAARITALEPDRQGTLYFSGAVGLWRWDPAESEPDRINGTLFGPKGASEYSRFGQDSDGAIWMTGGGYNGVVRFEGDSMELIGRPDMVESIANSLALLVDQENSVWIGGSEGLFRLRRQPVVTMVPVATGRKLTLRSLAEAPDGSLWFSDGGVCMQWAGADLIRVSFEFLGAWQLSWPVLCADQSGLWHGGGFPGLRRLPWSPAHEVGSVLPAPLFPQIGMVRAIREARGGGLWIASDQGLYRSVDLQSVERIDAFPSVDVRVLAEDARNNLWVGTAREGLYRVDSQGVQPLPLPPGLRGSRFLALHASSDGSVWMGTSSGLGCHRAGVVRAFAPESGLPQSAIYSITEDEGGRLWLNHDGGLSQVALQELNQWSDDPANPPPVVRFEAADGLLRSDSDPGATSGIRGRDGRLWFLKRESLAVVDPSEFLEAAPPVVWIEAVRTEAQFLPTDVALQLPRAAGRNVEFWFTTPELKAPEEVRFRYRLMGHDPGWREAAGVRRAAYANLPAGRYTFLARAASQAGRWSTQDAALSIEILPSPWETWWFQAIAATLTCASISGLVAWRFRRQRLLLQAERRQTLEAERRRIANDMHDHLGAQLAESALASGLGNVAHQQARETLRELNDLIWAVHPDNDSLPCLADFVANVSLRSLAAAGLQADLDVAPNLDAHPLPGSFRREISAMLKEALRNVIQHAGARRVAVGLSVVEDQLRLSIRDDGKGFSPAGVEGQGLSNLRSRSAALKGQVTITSAPIRERR